MSVVLLLALLVAAVGGQSDDDLLTLVQNQAAVIDSLTARLTAVENQLESIPYRTVIDSLTARLTAVENQLAHQQTAVGFNARFTTHESVTVTGGSNIVFDLVDFNLGHAYNKTSGMFTAPVSGLYLFSLHISHTPPGNVHVQMWTGGENGGHTVLAEMEASGDDPQYWDRASNTVLVQLEEGQRVWPHRVEGTSTELQGWFRSSFCGTLIRADSL